MTGYSELVEALRCDWMPDDSCKRKCPYADSHGYCDMDKVRSSAADAIEALLPKRGKWIRVQEVDIPGEMHPVAFKCMCSMCRNEYLFPRIPRYCPDCGSMNTAKMEVQDGK